MTELIDDRINEQNKVNHVKVSIIFETSFQPDITIQMPMNNS